MTITKNNNNKNKGYRPRKFTTKNKNVVISEPDDYIKDYICPFCSRIIQSRLSEGYIWCGFCHTEYLIEKTRKKSRLETPRGRDTETLVSTTPLPGYGDVAIKKPPNYRGAFKALSQKGIKIKDYKVTDDAGRTINEDDED